MKKMATNNIISEIAKNLLKAEDIALYCHTNPDGDALGCIMALYTALKKKGKTVYAFCDTEITKKYKFMADIDAVSFPDKKTHEVGLSLDISDIDRLGKCMKSFMQCRYTIAIDHHKSFQNFADLSYVEKTTSSCCEIIYSLIKEMKLLDRDVAAHIYTGMVTDTGCFAFSSVTGHTHTIVAEILDNYDFPHADIMYNAYRATTFNKFNLKIKALNKARFFENNQIAFVVYDKEVFEKTDTNINETEGIVAELINIDCVKVAYALSEVNPQNYKLSIRTKAGVDAAEIAGMFGGGGHSAAAGCRVNGYLEDIIEKLTKMARDRI